MKSLSLIMLWVSSIFFFTLYARDSDAGDFRKFNSRLCIGVDRASTSSGAYIKQFTCDGSDNQDWILNYTEGGRLTQLQNHKGSTAGVAMCMGVDRASRNPNAAIRQFPCDHSLNQTWFFVETTQPCNQALDAFCIINAKSGLCVGVDQASTANGAQLKQFPCDGRSNQFWSGAR